MKRVHVKDLKPNTKVIIAGFLQETRALSKVIFLIVRDVTGLVQCVVKEDSKFFDLAKKVNKESVISIAGKVSANKQAMNGLELVVDNIEVISEAETPLPIPVVEKGVETGLSKRLDWRYLDLRKRDKLLIMKVEGCFAKGLRDYWNKNGFIEMFSPKLIGTASESGSEVFMVPYFGREAFLAQSPQHYKQMAMAAGYEKVFEIGPVFRAEKSNTPRHNTEYTSVDMEISFIKDHYDIIKELENLITHAIKIVKEEFGKEVKDVLNVNIVVPKKPFPKITFAEAHEVIKKINGRVEDPGDLSSAEELILGEWVLKKHGSEFLFVVDYPWSKRPYYHMKNEDGKTTKSFDLLYKGEEIVTGSQRQHNYKILVEQANEKGLNIANEQHYADFFRYGCPPHGGLGMGIVRVIERMLNLKNIRESTYLTRDPDRLTP